jgi:SET domain-containing protein
LATPAFPITSDIGLALLRIASNPARSDLLSQQMREGGPDDVYVKSSPIHGLGLFARRTFATGEPILVREERPVTLEQPLDPSRGELEHHCDWLEGGRQVYLGYPSRHINHSCEPNAFLREQNGLHHVVALKPIRPNEEIVHHYGLNLWDGETWKCNCGSPRCLGTIPGDFFSLPLELKIELSPLLMPWFVAEHREEYRAFLREAGFTEEEVG